MRILAWLAVVAWAGSAAAKTPAKAGTTGNLIVVCATEGAEVVIDGETVGLVPLPGPLPLPVGDHSIKVTKLGYAPLNDVFKIEKKKDTRLEVELVPISGVLRVTANVEKARVLIDGKFTCEVPCSTEVPVGAVAVEVQKGGYKDFFQNIATIAGQEMALEVKLEELPAALNPYKPPPPPPPKWYEKWWVWTAGAGGVALIVTAVVVPVVVNDQIQNPVRDFRPHADFTLNLP
jgi:hypothetical protein